MWVLSPCRKTILGFPAWAVDLSFSSMWQVPLCGGGDSPLAIISAVCRGGHTKTVKDGFPILDVGNNKLSPTSQPVVNRELSERNSGRIPVLTEATENGTVL